MKAIQGNHSLSPSCAFSVLMSMYFSSDPAGCDPTPPRPLNHTYNGFCPHHTIKTSISYKLMGRWKTTVVLEWINIKPGWQNIPVIWETELTSSHTAFHWGYLPCSFIPPHQRHARATVSHNCDFCYTVTRQGQRREGPVSIAFFPKL